MKTDKWAKKYTGPTPEAWLDSRQQLRSRLRVHTFRDISAQFSGEPRKLRRAMALDKAALMYRQIKAEQK